MMERGFVLLCVNFVIHFCKIFVFNMSVFSLREHGATSLGPAALASVAMASRYPGSKVSEWVEVHFPIGSHGLKMNKI